MRIYSSINARMGGIQDTVLYTHTNTQTHTQTSTHTNANSTHHKTETYTYTRDLLIQLSTTTKYNTRHHTNNLVLATTLANFQIRQYSSNLKYKHNKQHKHDSTTTISRNRFKSITNAKKHTLKTNTPKDKQSAISNEELARRTQLGQQKLITQLGRTPWVGRSLTLQVASGREGRSPHSLPGNFLSEQTKAKGNPNTLTHLF